MSTSIQWTQETWNPVRGCSPVSPGCKHCYAERMAARNLPGMKSPTTGEPFAIMKSDGPHWTGKVELIPSMLDIPLRRKKPTTYFVNSMSDLFHEGLSDEDIDRVFAVMALCPQHTFQVLTKRAERMREYFSDGIGFRRRVVGTDCDQCWAKPPGEERICSIECDCECHEEYEPLPNVWLGVSVEDQPRKGRIDELRETPAAVRFLSLEPLLEDLGALDLRGIGWVIVGGESGPGARPCDIAWVRSIVGQCKDAGVACFVKQLGARPIADGPEWVQNWTCGASAMPDLPSEKRWLRLFDHKGGDMAEWPHEMRVREMPR